MVCCCIITTFYSPKSKLRIINLTCLIRKDNEVIYVGIQRNLVLNSRAQLISRRKPARRRRIDQKNPGNTWRKNVAVPMHRAFFTPRRSLGGPERRTDEPPDFKKIIRRSRHHRHPECSGHVNKERGSQINID